MAGKTQGTAFAELAELGKSLADAADNREKTTNTLKGILDLIGELDPDDAKALFKNEQVQQLIEAASSEIAQSSDDPPGTIYDRMIGGNLVRGFDKKAWSDEDLRKRVRSGEMEIVEYTPRTTQLVIYNGLQRQFIADEEMRVEKCFVDVYKDFLRNTKLAAEHAAWLFKKGTHLSDMSIVTGNGARARGTGEKGHYQPGGGMVSGRAGEDESE